MQGVVFLDVIVSESLRVIKLFSSENDSLLVLRDSFSFSNLALDGFNAVSVSDFESDGLSSESSHEDLFSSSESEYKVESRVFLDVVVVNCSAVFKSFSSEN